MNYRGIPGMKVHLYRWGELKRDLRRAGFQIQDVLPLDEVSAAADRRPWLAHSLRAGGWIVFAERAVRRCSGRSRRDHRCERADGRTIETITPGSLRPTRLQAIRWRRLDRSTPGASGRASFA